MIKEPPHLGTDKPWMSQLKDWCRTVKQELERIALRGDGVTTSISSGVIHSLPEDTPQWQVSQGEDSIIVAGGYVNWGGKVIKTWPSSGASELFDVSGKSDGDYLIVWATESMSANAGEVKLVKTSEIATHTTWKDYHVLALLTKEGYSNIITQKQTDEIIVNAVDNADAPDDPGDGGGDDEPDYEPGGPGAGDDPCEHPFEDPEGGGGIDDPDDPATPWGDDPETDPEHPLEDPCA